MKASAEWFNAAVARARKLDLADPRIAFSAAWFFGVAVAQIRIFSVQQPWSRLMWTVVLLVPVAFWLGGSIASAVVTLRVATADAAPREPAVRVRRRIRMVLVAFVTIGWLEEAHQWHAAHAIPLLAANVDAARAAQPGGPTIVLTDLLTVAAIFSLVVPRKLFSRSAVPELALAAAALSGFALAGGRVTVILPVAIALIARALYWRTLRLRHAVAIAFVAVVAISGLFFLRESQHRNEPFERELYGQVLPETPLPLRPLLPFHIAIATNFAALAGLVDYFPHQKGYGYGRYDAYGINLFVPSALNLAAISAQLTPPWVTSTVAGPLWADGGLPAVALGVAIIGFLSLVAYTAARRTRALRYSLVAAHLYFLALFGVYTNLWTQEVDWVLDVPLLFVLGAVAEGGLRHALGFPEWRAPRTRGSKNALWGAAAVAAVFALIVTLVVFVFPGTSGYRKSVASTRPKQFGIARIANLTLPTSPSGSSHNTSALWATDSGARNGAAVLWSLQRSGHDVFVHRFVWTNSATPKRDTWRLPHDLVAPGATFDVARWRDGTALFLVHQTPRGVVVRRTTPAERDKPINLAPPTLAPFRVPPRSEPVFFGIGTWSGKLPDLIVVTCAKKGHGRMLVYSGESNFQRRVSSKRLLPAPVCGPAWNVDFIQTSKNSIYPVFLLRDGRISGSGRPEIHVLDARQSRRRILDAPLELPKTLPAAYRLIMGSFKGLAVTYGIDPARRTVAVFPVMAGS